MQNPDKQKHNGEQRENELPSSDSDLVQSGRKAIGSYEKDVHIDKVWDEQEIQKRMDELRSKHETPSLLEIYDHNADVFRLRALQILTDAKKENRELTGEEEKEIIVAQMRVTIMENLSRASDAYMDLMELYHTFKKEGMTGKDEGVVLEHFALLQQAAAKRVANAEKLMLNAGTEADKKALQEQSIALDNELLKLLASQDESVPGANKDGVLPAHRVILSMLEDEYRDITDDYKDAANRNHQERKDRIEKGTDALKAMFPDKDDSEITEEEQNRALQTVAPGYTMRRYHEDQAVVKDASDLFDTLKARGQKNVERLAELNATLGRYQIYRAELASIRHHFDQGFDTADAKGKPRPGSTSPEAIKLSREFLEAQQKGALNSLDVHMQRVESGVLKVGIKEKTETFTNETARTFLVRLADKIATLETSWMPNIPGLRDDFLQNRSREYLMGGLYDALGWPRDANGDPKKELTPTELQQIKEKQDSVEKSIDRFKETGVVERLKTSIDAAKALANRTDLKAEHYFEPGEVDPATLPADTVTAENMDALVLKYGVPTVYKMCYTQFSQNWEAYGEQYKTLLVDFHNVVGVHYDFTNHWNEFADKQAMNAMWLYLLAGAGLVLGPIVIWKMTKGSAKLMGRAAKGSVRLGGKGIDAARKGISRLRTPKTPSTPKNVVPEAPAPKAPSTAGAASEGAAVEKAAEKASRASKIGRVLGPLAIVLSAIDLRRIILRDSRLEELREFDGVQSAIELMENHGNKDAYRYKAEMGYLRNRLDAMVIMDGSEKLLHELELRYPTADKKIPSVEAVKDRCIEIRKKARADKMEFTKLFPVTDYLMTDPERGAGNVGVNIRDIDDARARGMEYEKQRVPNYDLSKFFNKPEQPKAEKPSDLTPEQAQQLLKDLANGIQPLSPFQQLKADYEQLLSDGADLLELP